MNGVCCGRLNNAAIIFQVRIATGAIMEELHNWTVGVGKIRSVKKAWRTPDEIVGVTVVTKLFLPTFCARHGRSA